MPRIRSWKDIANLPGYRSALRGTLRYLFGQRGQRRLRSLRLYYRLRMLMMLRSGETISRLARRREVRLWVDGEESFARLEQLIRRAQHHIIVQMFIWKNDATGRRIAQLLLDAAERGVTLDIAKEAVGDFFEFHGDFMTTKSSTKEPWPRFWNHPNIRIVHSTDNDHAKVFTIDDHTLLLTGMNIADEYRHRWHDYLVEVRGPSFVRQFLTMQESLDPNADIRLVMNVGNQRNIRPVLMDLLRNARQSVVIEHCYISDEAVIEELVALTQRGVRVTMILPKTADFHYHANMVMVGRLMTECASKYLSIHIYPQMFHAKVLLVDHAIAFVGSANLFRASIDDMGEVNVLVRGKQRFLWKLREQLRMDILASTTLTSPPPLLWLSRWLSWMGL